MATDCFVLLATGGIAGLVGALVGVGGGVIVVPVLHLVLGLSLESAVGTSLLVITGTSVVGTAGYLERDLVEVRTGLELQVGVLLGAVAAASLAPWVNPRVIAWTFAGALLWAVAVLWLPALRPAVTPSATGVRRTVAWGLSPLGGGAAGLLGIGGGLVLVPILRLVLGLDIRRAVGTSTFLIGLTASVAALVYWNRGAVDPAAVPWLLAGILAGGAAAPWVSERLPGRLIEVGFSLVALYGAYRMATG